jgi:iron-sulfur cluster repair protein YtfE (RIC family)
VSLVRLGQKPPADETPEGLILDCHARIRTFCDLAVKLATEAATDEALADAATRVHRYFTQALPLHVADEEQTLAPRLRRFAPETLAALTAMERQHREHEPLLDGLIRAWRGLVADPGPRAASAGDAARLRAELERHLGDEERLIVPALARLPGEERRSFVDEVRQRRRRP